MVVVPLIVEVGACAVTVPPTVVVALTMLVLVTASGVIVRPLSKVTTAVDVDVTSGDVYDTVVVSLSTTVFVTSGPVKDAVDVTLSTVVEVTSACVMAAVVVSWTMAVVVV